MFNFNTRITKLKPFATADGSDKSRNRGNCILVEQASQLRKIWHELFAVAIFIENYPRFNLNKPKNQKPKTKSQRPHHLSAFAFWRWESYTFFSFYNQRIFLNL